MKPIIAVDVDDVLSVSAEGFTAYSNKTWGTDLTADQYDDNWGKMWGVSFEDAERRANQFHASGVIGTYRQFEAALPVLGGLKRQYELIVLTSRRVSVKDETLRWIDAYFPDTFQAIYFSGLWDNANETAVTASKAQMCKELGVSYLIDDQLRHCAGAVEIGAHAILFGDYPWTNIDKLPEGIRRCASWQKVEEYFDGARR